MAYLATRLLSSRRLSGQLRHQKTGVLAYKTLVYVFTFKAFLTYHFLIIVIGISASIVKLNFRCIGLW